MHHRNYNPKTGVFTSADPAKDDLNLYRYVKNNPVNRTDPSGLEEFESQGPLTPHHLRKLGEDYLDRNDDTGRSAIRRHLIEPDDVPVLIEILDKLKLSDFEFSDDQLVQAGKLLDMIRYYRSIFKSDIAIKLEWELEGDLKQWSREQKFLDRERVIALGKLNAQDPRIKRIADWAKRIDESEKLAITEIHQSGAGPTSTFLQTLLHRALTIVERSVQTGSAIATAPDAVIDSTIEQIDEAGNISRDAHAESATAGVVMFVAELSNFARYADSVEGRTREGRQLSIEEINEAETAGLVGGVLLAGEFLTLFAEGAPLHGLAGSSQTRISKVLDRLPQSRRGAAGIPGDAPSSGPMKRLKRRPSEASTNTSTSDADAGSTSQPSTPGSTTDIVAPKGDRNWIFRGDSNYKGGPVGRSLGAEADVADIQNFADHVLRKESRQSSRYTSFTTETKIARNFPPANDNRYVSRAMMDRLRELEAKGQIKIWTPDEVYEVLRNGPQKLRKQASDVRAAMQKNSEILIEGQIPDGFLQGTN